MEKIKEESQHTTRTTHDDRKSIFPSSTTDDASSLDTNHSESIGGMPPPQDARESYKKSENRSSLSTLLETSGGGTALNRRGVPPAEQIIVFPRSEEEWVPCYGDSDDDENDSRTTRDNNGSTMYEGWGVTSDDDDDSGTAVSPCLSSPVKEDPSDTKDDYLSPYSIAYQTQSIQKNPYWVETLAGNPSALENALRNAIRVNDVSTVETLFSMGGVMNLQLGLMEQFTNRSALWYAAAYGSSDCIRAIVSAVGSANNSANNSVSNGSSKTQRRTSASNTNMAVAEPVFQQPSQWGSQPILIAAAMNHPNAVQTLISLNVCSVDDCNKYGATASIIAAVKGYADVMDVLCRNDADKNKCNPEGLTLAMICAKLGHVEVLKVLFTWNADFRRQDKKGRSVVTIASCYNRPNVIKYFSSILDNPLHQQRISNRIPNMNELVGNFKETPLSIATMKNNVEAVIALLRSPHVNVVATNAVGMTFLFVAAKLNRVDVVFALCKSERNAAGEGGVLKRLQSEKKTLFENKFTVFTLKDKVGKMTPLFCALDRGHHEIVEYLAPVYNLNNSFYGEDMIPPLVFCAMQNDVDNIMVLLTAGANVDQIDAAGHSALTVAARHGLVDVCAVLAQYGANLKIQSKKGGGTPLQKARRYKHAQVVEFLEQYSSGP